MACADGTLVLLKDVTVSGTRDKTRQRPATLVEQVVYQQRPDIRRELDIHEGAEHFTT